MNRNNKREKHTVVENVKVWLKKNNINYTIVTGNIAKAGHVYFSLVPLDDNDPTIVNRYDAVYHMRFREEGTTVWHTCSPDLLLKILK